jgi:FKBP-type peptidyl-prolyl cis-trans isomerase
MNITATAVAVTLAIAIGVAFLFFGPNVLRPFQAAQVTDQAMQATTTTTSSMTDSSNGIAETIKQPLPTSLTFKDEVEGTGPAAKAGDTVTVNYIGALPDGTVFDASAKHGQAFSFKLGDHQVIQGWDIGVAGMKVGGKRILVIPPDMAYGSQGAGGVIPPNATLIFEVELVKIGQ